MPQRDLNAVLLPLDIANLKIEQNITAISGYIDKLPAGPDIIVLPELCFTGFTTDRSELKKLAEKNDGKCMQAVAGWSRQTNACLCGSFLATDGEGHYYNRGFMVFPEGEAVFYDKHHLFCSGGEGEVFTGGKSIAPVVEFRTWKIKLSICYDIRFPVWNRNVNLDYDLLVVPANWPHSRSYAWRQLLTARAIENQTYVAACDRTGTDLYGDYDPGDSMIIDHWGKPVSEQLPDGAVFATLEAEKINSARQKFTPWRDADSFEILEDLR